MSIFLMAFSLLGFLGDPVAIASDEEPGSRLMITGQIVNGDGAPIEGAQVTAWHTDAKGYYSEGNQGDPRLEATATSDKQGYYAFSTIMPGGYAGEDMAAHVHFRVTADGYSAAGATIQFADDPHVSKWRVERQLKKGAFADILQSQHDDEGRLTVRRDFRLE